jgi:hypothetical protein
LSLMEGPYMVRLLVAGFLVAATAMAADTTAPSAVTFN